MGLSSLRFAAVTLAAFAICSKAFVLHRPASLPSRAKPILQLSASPGGGEAPKSSRIEGNMRAPTVEELKLMDEMIDKLADAKPYELPNAVRRAFRVVSSPQFFLRIANRTDQAEDEVQRQKLAALATNLVSTLEAVVSTTEDQLDERSEEVQRVVKAAAEPDSGEFLVPLLPERISAMRKELEALDESSLDESFLSTLDAWMNKSHQDGMDLMVGILQKVLQMYAGTQITRARSRNSEVSTSDSSESELFDQLLKTDADAWDAVIMGADDVPALLTEVQRTTETIVLSLEAGSMVQRVQAEYMQELMKRIETIQKQKKQ